MLRLYEPRSDTIGKHVFTQEQRKARVDAANVRYAAAKDDNVGIENVDYARERARQAIEVRCNALLRGGFSFGFTRSDLRRRKHLCI
jgi:hypothetical protein